MWFGVLPWRHAVQVRCVAGSGRSGILTTSAAIRGRRGAVGPYSPFHAAGPSGCRRGEHVVHGCRWRCSSPPIGVPLCARARRQRGRRPRRRHRVGNWRRAIVIYSPRPWASPRSTCRCCSRLPGASCGDRGLSSSGIDDEALTLCTLAGHPESLFLNVLVGCVYALFELVRNRISPWRPIATALAAGLLAFALSAMFLLPLFEAFPQSAELAIKSGQSAYSQGQTTERALAALARDLFPYLHVRNWTSPNLGHVGAETAAAELGWRWRSTRWRKRPRNVCFASLAWYARAACAGRGLDACAGYPLTSRHRSTGVRRSILSGRTGGTRVRRDPASR